MSLRDQIDVDLKAAMIAKDAAKTSTLRMIKSALRNKEIDLKKPLEDSDMIGLLSTMKKQRDESITQFKTGGREDLVAKEQAEIDLINTYLPKQLSAEEIDTLVAAAIATSAAAGPKDMGKVMKLLTEQTKGKADGRLVSERVKAKLEALGK
jgi:uncharacterized protein YqeY